ncbi:unnamed protein product [Calicophoron daubneyi]|uniref:LisH domain-containing protein n=1 Tax=Calicophoron daubneyi TaxID=300641 RepID=A0AAV2TTT0_CALDB
MSNGLSGRRHSSDSSGQRAAIAEDCSGRMQDEENMVADYLLEQKLYLSALEYYFENLERGRKIPVLHNFFADASFFEKLNPVHDDLCCGGVDSHYQSVSTLDSFDIGRISDDGNTLEERVKVLEYEVRKKNDEIQNLRGELTDLTVGRKANETELLKNPNVNEVCFGYASTQPRNAQPHESRALAVLINDYLLQNNCRLSAVQFVEEAESTGLQDIESWEQVGINLPKPPNLLYLLRSYWSNGNAPNKSSDFRIRGRKDAATGTDTVSSTVELTLTDYWAKTFEIQSKTEQLTSLQAQVKSLESKNAQLAEQAQNWRNQLICLEREHAEMVASQHGTFPGASDKLTSVQGQKVYRDTVVKLEDSVEDASKKSLPKSCQLDERRQSLRHLYSRCPSLEFRTYMTDLLPKHDVQLDMDQRTLHLAENLDEFVSLVADRLEISIPSMSDEGKTLMLPLLTQAICLHPSSAARDRLLRLLFHLFSTHGAGSDSASPTAGDDSSLLSSTASDSSMLSDSHHHRLLILNACRRLASYLGPTRLESELIPQLWSQLNERPAPSASRRLLLVSACGVVSPSIPPHLQSSLMLSILESNLDEERNELIKAASIRSLACLVSLMSDNDKLPQLVQRLNHLLVESQQSSSAFRLIGPEADGGAVTDGFNEGCAKPSYVTTIDWLLPSVAQWCLELDTLHTTLIDPWLDSLDSYILATNSAKAGKNADPKSVIHCLDLLDYLNPFLHAWLFVTLVEPEQSDQTYWAAAMSWASSSQSKEVSNATNVSQLLNDALTPTDSIINVGLILGYENYKALQLRFECVLDTLTKSSASASGGSSRAAASPDTVTYNCPTPWAAKIWFENMLFPKLIDLLTQVPRKWTKKNFLNTEAVNIYEQDELLENFVNHQYDEFFAGPWGMPFSSDEFSVCLSISRFLTSFGSNVGLTGVQKLLSIMLQNHLMEKTGLGNFEYNRQTMQTGLLAGYCCLLSSVKAKTESSKVRMLITNAIFLHAREAYPLDSIRLAIWCLCLTSDLESVVTDLLLPALRPCVSCADNIVRRTAASLLHTLIETLSYNRKSQPTNDGSPMSTEYRSMLDQVCHLLGQLARDDLTGQRKRINPDEADWSVLAVSLGPVYSMLSLCRLFKSRPLETPSTVFTCPDKQSTGVKNNLEQEDQLFELISLQMDLVIGQINDASASTPGPSSDTDTLSNRLLLAQHRYWMALVQALLSLTNRILPSCQDSFRDKVVLPWLYYLAEINNSLPNLDERTLLADRLFAVLSTAAYSIQADETLLLWLFPALDRVRLDLVEAGDTRRTREVEQFLSDMYTQMKSNEAGPISEQSKEIGSLRNVVSSQLAKLSIRNNVLPNTQQRATHTETKRKLASKTKPFRLTLKKR